MSVVESHRGRIASLALTDLPRALPPRSSFCTSAWPRLVLRPSRALSLGVVVHGIAARGGPGITTTTRLTGSPLIPVLETGGGRRQKTGDTGDQRQHPRQFGRARGFAGEPRARYPSQAAGSLGLILARIHSTSLVAPGLWVILVWFLVPFFWCLHLSLPCLALPYLP